MTDVAKKAGVSVGTVSLVLNDKPGISAEVRDHVQQSAAELGYRLPQRRPAAAPMTSVTVVHYAGQRAGERAPRTSGVLVDIPINSVGQDHRQATQIAMDYLVGLGNRQIGLVASHRDEQPDWFASRLHIYRSAMSEIGQDQDDLIVIADCVSAAVERLIAQRPDITAIFSLHDEVAIEAMVALDALGMKIPDEISVIGLDDSATPPKSFPALTTVGFPHREVGRLAAELLLNQIEDDTLLYSHIFVRSHLVERDSCAPPR